MPQHTGRTRRLAIVVMDNRLGVFRYELRGRRRLVFGKPLPSDFGGWRRGESPRIDRRYLARNADSQALGQSPAIEQPRAGELSNRAHIGTSPGVQDRPLGPPAA